MIWGVMAFFAVGVALYAAQYLSFEKTGILFDKGELINRFDWKFAFYCHIAGGLVALATGAFQFANNDRSKSMTWHQRMGKVYVFSILGPGGLSGLFLAFYATGNWVSKTGFALLAISWLISTGQAWRKIRIYDIQAHNDWMIRSYALTFAAVTLRLWLGIFQGVMEWAFLPSYIVISWLCWVPNLVFAEWFIRRPGRQLEAVA